MQLELFAKRIEPLTLTEDDRRAISHFAVLGVRTWIEVAERIVTGAAHCNERGAEIWARETRTPPALWLEVGVPQVRLEAVRRWYADILAKCGELTEGAE